MSALLVPQSPSPENLALIQQRARWGLPLIRSLLWPLVRIEVEGQENVPRAGPCLVLCNHISMLDPVLVAVAANRAIQWMGSESLMENPILGRFAILWGIVPKKKFTSDMRSVRELSRWAGLGACVGLFPEGQRPWDGQPLPLQPHTDRLVRAFGVPLVTARLYNADHHWPRWALRPRMGTVKVVFDPPVMFKRDHPLEEIQGYLESHLRVEEQGGPRWPVYGVSLARGVDNLLFACPSCFRFDQLSASGSTVACGACGAAWRVDTQNRLHPKGGGGPELLSAASQRIRAHVQGQGMLDADCFARCGALLESAPIRLLNHDQPRGRLIGEGRLRLYPDRLTLEGSDWVLPLKDLRSVSAEQRRRLWLRTDKDLFEPVIPIESTCKWEWILEYWRLRAQPPEAE